jgi:hypothetical protein
MIMLITYLKDPKCCWISKLELNLKFSNFCKVWIIKLSC